jgi:tetratricopeptide (TPR) repeat protein
MTPAFNANKIKCYRAASRWYALCFIFILSGALNATEDTLRAWLKKVPRDTTTVDILFLVCQEDLRSKPPEQVAPYIEEAKKICAELLVNASPAYAKIIKKKLSRVLIVNSVLYSHNGEYEKELAVLNEALKLLQEINLKAGIANIYNNIAACYAEQGLYIKSLDYNFRSLRIREELGDSSSLAQTYQGIGMVYFRTKKYDDALKYCERALRINKSLNDVAAVAEGYGSIGGIYFEMDQFDRALEYWKKTLPLSDSLNHILLKAHVLNNIGNVYDKRKQADSAILCYTKAIALYTEVSDAISRVATVANLGGAYFIKGNYALAKKILSENIDSVKKYRQGLLLESVYNALVACDSAMGNFRDAFIHSRLLRQVAAQNAENRSGEKLGELKLNYEIDRRDEEHRRILDQNQIQALQINRSRLVATILAVVLFFSVITFLLLYRQYRYKSERKAAELRQRLLRSQMNPHFLFNVLQAIQNYLVHHGTKESLVYLDSFAMLTREVLEHSRAEHIPLSKEIEMLTNYLRLQKLRFGDRFDYSINIPSSVNAAQILVPPMLSQPFIENAIEHGLSEVEAGGKVEVSFDVQDDVLHMEIVDNGTGMRETNKEEKDHNSLAIQITTERIALLNRRKKKKTTFSITDAYPTEPERKGVRVSFRIPVVRG